MRDLFAAPLASCSVRAALVASLALLGLACAGAMPPTTEYLLRNGEAGTGTPVETSSEIVLGRVDIAAYLERAGIVVEIAPGQLRAANGHRWAEPLEEGVRALLRAELSRALDAEVGTGAGGAPRDAIRVELDVGRLHGTLDGSALLEATYRILKSDAPPREYRFAASERLTRDGYPGLVDAERVLLARLADAIAGTLRP